VTLLPGRATQNGLLLLPDKKVVVLLLIAESSRVGTSRHYGGRCCLVVVVRRDHRLRRGIPLGAEGQLELLIPDREEKFVLRLFFPLLLFLLFLGFFEGGEQQAVRVLREARLRDFERRESCRERP
jgi:hypothetical protein